MFTLQCRWNIEFQVLWEPQSCRKYPRAAIIAQELCIYHFEDQQWTEVANINAELSRYLSSEPLENHTKDVGEKYKVHCSHVKYAVWSHKMFHSQDSSQHNNSIIFCTNSYGNVFGVTLSDDTRSQHCIKSLTPSSQPLDVSSIGWCQGSSEQGKLLIGCNDGTCMTLTLDASVKILSSGSLKLDKDFRSVQHLNYIKVRFIGYWKALLMNALE